MDNSPATGRNSMSEELNDIEQQKLKNLESIIERNLPLIRMTPQEARACVDDINNNLRNTRALLLDLYEREGWKALGYDSWRACVVGEFGKHQSYLYRQLEAAKAEIAISPKGENSVGSIPERHLRPLTSLPPDEQREVYQKAVETAPEGKVTAKHVEKTVSEYKHTETHTVTHAMEFATMAISQLERIRPDDPKRDEALRKVSRWIKKQRAENNRSHK